MKLVEIIYWILNVIVFVVIIYSINIRIKTRKLIKLLELSNEERNKNYDTFVTNFNERLNLLSKENNKLRSQNEELKERLRDLGIKDFDVL